MLAGWAGLGWAGLAGCFCVHFLSLRFILSHFISSPISCHVPLEDEMDQYLNVNQWENKSEKESKKKEEDEVEIKIIVKKRAPKKLDHFIYYPP